METEKICPSCQKPLPAGVPLGLCPECLIKSGFPTGTDPAAGAQGGFVPPSVEEIARLFPQFEILGFIGKGGMGAVYKARQPALDRFVALKVLPPAVANDPGFAERFNREARALARLSHPNIVVVYDFGKAGALHYLVMEFVDGTNLREIERAGKLSPEQALAIVPQICEALQFAHNEGIVHRDIKPENLLLDKKGRLKITDFGIAKILNVPSDKVSLTGAKDVMGTPHYMAPEQIEKPQTVDHRADIYSLGVVFYEMLTGELPLGKFAPPSKKVQVDVRLDEVVLHTLEKEPERRYQQASQIKTDVETITTTKATPVGAATMAGALPAMISVPSKAASDKIILPAFLLAFFFGIFGAHRFYVGKIGTGIAQLFTLGGLGIWTAIDWILILCKVFTDADGKRLTNWWHPSDVPGRPAAPSKGQSPSNISGSSPMIVAPVVVLMLAGFIKLFEALKELLFLHWPGYKLFNNLFFHYGLPDPMAPFLETMLFRVIPALVMIYGAVQMVRLRNYAWSTAGAIVAIVFCSLAGFPAGIWALIVLTREDVMAAFENPERRENIKWPAMLGITGIATFLLFLVFNLPNHHVQARKLAMDDPSSWPEKSSDIPTGKKQPKDLQQAVRDAVANLADVEARFKTGAATPMDVTLAKDKKKLADAQRLLELQRQAYNDGQTPPQVYHEFWARVSSAEAQLQSDEAELQSNKDKAQIDSQMAKGTNTAAKLMSYDRSHFKRIKVTKVAKATKSLLAYQWYVGGSNTAAGASAQMSASDAGTSNGTLNSYFQTDAVQIAVSNAANTNEGRSPQIQDPPTISNAQPDGDSGITTVNNGKDETVDIGNSRDFSRSVRVESGGQLTMNVDRGDVTISSADQNSVDIHVTREVTGASDPHATKILKEEHLVLEHAGNQISITAQDPHPGFFGFGANLNVHYEITVPREFNARVKTSGGNIKVTGIQGNANINTMGGNLDCEDIRGDVDSQTMGGNLNYENIDGDVNAHTMGGNVQAAKCNGKLRIKTNGGNITIDEFKGPSVQATTGGGRVSADLLVVPASDCKLGSGGGDVTVRLPGNSAVTLNAQTGAGRIDTDLPLPVTHNFSSDSLDGSLNGGGPKLQLETGAGNIQIMKQ